MRSHGGYGPGKSPLDTFNPVDKILFMGIPYRRAVFENGSHLSTKFSFENVLIPRCERSKYHSGACGNLFVNVVDVFIKTERGIH